MTTILHEKMQKMQNEYTCISCSFTTVNKYNYKKHLLTAKHLNTTNYIEDTIILQQNLQGDQNHTCNCGKTYPYRASLYNHKKKCNYKGEKKIVEKKIVEKKIVEKNIVEKNIVEKNIVEKNIVEKKIVETEEVNDTTGNIISQKDISNDISKDLILKLVAENSEIKNLLFKQFETMQTQMLDQQKVMQTQISELIPRVGNNNTINNKQKFNINIFLNEQCKGAQTIEQFLKDIHVTMENLAVTRTKGLCEGVSTIFIENMNKLSLYERPMHCTDVKREIVYVKSEENLSEEDTPWKKDGENKKLKHALKTISHIQRVNLQKWVELHPNWMEKEDEQNEYIELMRNTTSCLVESNKEDKAIKKVCNKIHINEALIDETSKIET
jgi:hypothetical protein